ncbi:MAG: DUF3379 domain-containing protein [Gammaproteobacteria bacterium]|nr:DUF3379 domain-containing protein [Gammaproteobacteria bacterium]
MTVSGKNMNCEEYKEAIAADPSATFEGADHAAACDSCAAFTVEMQALDAKIAGALAINTPNLEMPELPPIEDDNVVNMPFQGKRRVPTWLAIAASFALAAIIGVQLIGNEAGDGLSLADEILAHLDHEPGAFRETVNPVGDARFSRVVNAKIGTMDRGVGLITYAQSCVINGKTVPHLVLQGENGPITLLLMPDETIDMAKTFMGQGVNGVIIPHGEGSIAIIGENEQSIGEIEQRVIDSVEWSI